MYSDAEAMLYRGQKPFENIAQAKAALLEVEQDFAEGKKYRLGIELKENKKLIGTFLIKNVQEESCMIGYSLDKQYWGKGIMTEVCKAMMQFLFEKQNMKILFATVREGNERSIRLLEKLQFTFVLKDENKLLHFQHTQKQNPH